jgi:hypothetical protein
VVIDVIPGQRFEQHKETAVDVIVSPVSLARLTVNTSNGLAVQLFSSW